MWYNNEVTNVSDVDKYIIIRRIEMKKSNLGCKSYERGNDL